MTCAVMGLAHDRSCSLVGQLSTTILTIALCFVDEPCMRVLCMCQAWIGVQ